MNTATGRIRIGLAFLVLSLWCGETSIIRAQMDQLTKTEKLFLIRLARQTLEEHLKSGNLPTVDKKDLTPALLEKKACFVTLTKYGELRGCIGMFYPVEEPLYCNVMSRAIAAATEDPRFPQVRPAELRDIEIEISILTIPQELRFDSPQDLLDKLQPGSDGVIIQTMYGGSTFLPQVWEQLPDKEQFLSHLCLKHGAPPNYWKSNYKQLKVQTYQAVVFSEHDLLQKSPLKEE